MIEDDELVVETLSQLLKSPEKFPTQQSILRALGDFSLRLSESEANGVDFDLSEINRYLKSGRRPTGRKLAFLLKWLETDHPEAILSVRNRLSLEQSDPFFSIIRHLLGDTGHAQSGYEELIRLNGHYRMFRRSPFHPESRVLISELQVGDVEQPSLTKLTARYTDLDGQAVDSVASGRISPVWGNKAVVVLHYRPRGSAIMMLEGLTFAESGNGNVQSAVGILTNTLSGPRSSAWPIYMERIDNDLVPVTDEVPIDQVHGLSTKLDEQIACGFIDWRL